MDSNGKVVAFPSDDSCQAHEAGDFTRAYAEWLAARAAVCNIGASTACNDDALGSAQTAERKALWGVIQTPLSMVGDKHLLATFVLTMVSDTLEMGRPTDQRDYMAVAKLAGAVLQEIMQ